MRGYGTRGPQCIARRCAGSARRSNVARRLRHRRLMCRHRHHKPTQRRRRKRSNSRNPCRKRRVRQPSPRNRWPRPRRRRNSNLIRTRTSPCKRRRANSRRRAAIRALCPSVVKTCRLGTIACCRCSRPMNPIRQSQCWTRRKKSAAVSWAKRTERPSQLHASYARTNRRVRGSHASACR